MGSAFASNFYQGTMYYTLQLDASSGGWQNGTRFDSEALSQQSVNTQIASSNQTEQTPPSLVNSYGAVFSSYSLLGVGSVVAAPWLGLSLLLPGGPLNKHRKFRNHSYHFRGSNYNLESSFVGGGKN
jgi:hypothetical protein